MIQLSKNNLTEVVIYNSNYEYSTAGNGTYGITLINDLTKEVYTYELEIFEINSLYFSFKLDTTILELFGFYIMYIKLDNEIVYLERCSLSRKLNLGDNKIDTYTLKTINQPLNIVAHNNNGSNGRIIM